MRKLIDVKLFVCCSPRGPLRVTNHMLGSSTDWRGNTYSSKDIEDTQHGPVLRRIQYGGTCVWRNSMGTYFKIYLQKGS